MKYQLNDSFEGHGNEPRHSHFVLMLLDVMGPPHMLPRLERCQKESYYIFYYSMDDLLNNLKVTMLN